MSAAGKPTLLLLLLLLLLLPLLAAAFGSSESALSRRKRYVVFPEGSTFTVAFCVTFQTTFGPDDIWTEGLNWAVSYDLPNETRADQNPLGPLLTPLQRRRARRDLYGKLELLLDKTGTDGRACVLRALCEAAQRFLPGDGMLEQMLRVAFTQPLERVLSWEPPEHRQYSHAHRAGLGGRSCSQLFPSCPVSLLDLALGPLPS